MKPVIILVLFACSLLFITGCGNKSSSLTQNDSLAVASTYVKDHPEIAAGSFYHVFEKLKVGQDSLDKMRQAYNSVLTFHLPDPYTGGWATGFNVDTADFNDMVKLGSAGKVITFGFHFAIRNYTQFAQGALPLYTMEVVPIGPGYKPFPAGLQAATSTTTATSYGYDFVDPCPGGLGCPTN